MVLIILRALCYRSLFWCVECVHWVWIRWWLTEQIIESNQNSSQIIESNQNSSQIIESNQNSSQIIESNQNSSHI